MSTSILSSHNATNKLIKLGLYVWLEYHSLWQNFKKWRVKHYFALGLVIWANGAVAGGDCSSVQALQDIEAFLKCKNLGGTTVSDTAYFLSGVYASSGDAAPCSSPSDETCSGTWPTLASGDWLYVKNTSGVGYYKGEWNGTGFVKVSMYTPSSTYPPPPPPPPETKVTIAFGGDGQGRVTSSPLGIDCRSPNACSYTFTTKDTIKLTALPIGQGRFQNWGVGCNNGNISPSGTPVYCMVYFVDTTPPTYTLLVEKAGTGTGTVTTTGIECGTDCIEDFTEGTSLTILAQADTNSQFTGWQKDCTGTDSITQLIINSDKRCVAVFDVLLPDDPVPDPTTDPIPDPTTDPIPDPTTDPVPDPTTDPVPDPTADLKPRYSSKPAVGDSIILQSELGHPSTAQLTVIEVGDATLEVSSAELTDKETFGISEGSPPFSLPDGSDPHTLTISCIPRSAIQYQGKLILSTNDETQPTVSYPLECTGVSVNKENHPPTDILLSNNSLAEDSFPGKQIGILSTIDPDEGDTHTYTLLDDGGGYFTLTGQTLRLAQNAYFNRQQNPTHTIVVRSTDTGGLFFDKTLTVQVTESVTFSGEIYTREGKLLGNNVAIDEPEQFKFMGYIKVNPISNHLGKLVDIIMTYHWKSHKDQQELTVPITMLQQVILQENMQIALYEGHLVNLAGIFAVDLGYRLPNGQFIQGQIVTVDVRPDRPPTAIQLSKYTVKERSPAGTMIGELTTTDPDKDDWFIYDLIENPENHFAIAGNKLIVGYGFPIDFEAQKTYSVTIRSTDAAGKSIEEIFTILVENEITANAIANVRGAEGFLLAERPLILKSADKVSVWAHLFPDMNHLGQRANVTMSSEQKLITGEVIEDRQLLAENVTLTVQMDFMLLMGPLEIGEYHLNVGYQLLKETFVFEQAVLSFEVTEDSPN